MCGIAGFWLCDGTSRDLKKHLEQMTAAITHRGPDSKGYWMDESLGLALGHCRLSILELSSSGNQPMTSACKRYVVVFNGEIYNHLDLRNELMAQGKAPLWKGHADTETLLACFSAWGIEGTIKRSIGMFAFAVWDRHSRALILARDRLGEKPLYYGWQGRTFMFGSELKALSPHPAFQREINRNAIALFMRHGYIPAPYSIYKGIYKLLPGTMLIISMDKPGNQPRRYWDACQVVADGLARPFPGSPDDAVDELNHLLKDAVAKQMVADVPLGAFLSGGVDSSTIVALMQAQSSRPVRTFTIGFTEEGYNEAEHAKAVAHHLGTDHTELYVTPEQAIDVIPRLPMLYDEPFADSSQIPTFMVSQMTKQYVTVSLSGDAGDELFGGYNRYVLGQHLWETVSRLPTRFRTALVRLIRGVSPKGWNRLLGPLQRLLPLGLAQANIGDKLHKGADALAANTPEDLYYLLVSHWLQPENLVASAAEDPTVLTTADLQPRTDHFVHQMMALDMLTYLPDDILTKVDRAAMGVSLETRVPLLDHRVVEFAWHLPLSFKVREGVGKWPLRQLLNRYIPKELIERPKMGFGFPIDSWLRGPLRDWAENLLDESRLRNEGYFVPDQICQKWIEHLAGKRNWQYHLWEVLMFQAWHEHWVNN